MTDFQIAILLANACAIAALMLRDAAGVLSVLAGVWLALAVLVRFVLP